jgi:aquaporin NIP
VLFALIFALGAVSGGHFNPAVTAAAAALRRIDPVDAVVYILAQLSGGVLGALLAKGLLLDEGRASHYGAATISPLLSGNFAGFVVEGLGTFVLVMVVLGVLFNPRVRQEWGPLAIGLSLAFLVMVFGPLTGAAFNPARWFGPALIGEEFGDVWPYLGGELIGALLAAGFFVLVLAPGERGVGPAETGAERRGPPGT